MDVERLAEVMADEGTPLIRTDFADDHAWQRVIEAVSKPVDFDDPDNLEPGDDAYALYVVAIDDRTFEGVTGSSLGEAVTVTDGTAGYVLLADARSMEELRAGSELTVDYVDLSVSSPEDAELFDSFLGRTFRCAVSEIASIEANLSIANMDFGEFADNTDPDGVFRGFHDA
ncbi:DUF6924 domain-containing protein [Nocardioides sp.]|uniref:DUF6924 domain-containing protein n=1 Tax=Nocardioides sp. TaxID=35761 RepID=UPI003785111B